MLPIKARTNFDLNSKKKVNQQAMCKMSMLSSNLLFFAWKSAFHRKGAVIYFINILIYNIVNMITRCDHPLL
jgi:hypothetical protein